MFRRADAAFGARWQAGREMGASALAGQGARLEKAPQRAVLVEQRARAEQQCPLDARSVGEPIEHLEVLIAQTVTTLERHPNFLRLLIGFAAQPPSDGDVHAVVGRVREMALTRLRKQIAIATGRNPRTRDVDDLARFALAAVDGAFVASQTDSGVTLARILAPLPAALVA